MTIETVSTEFDPENNDISPLDGWIETYTVKKKGKTYYYHRWVCGRGPTKTVVHLTGDKIAEYTARVAAGRALKEQKKKQPLVTENPTLTKTTETKARKRTRVRQAARRIARGGSHA